MVDRPVPDDTLKRGERHSGEKAGKGSAESTKPYGEKKKSKSYDASRYSYPYPYRDPKASTSLQVLRKHRPDELEGISNFTAILYYFVGTFWCLLFSLLLWLHIYSDPIPVEKVIHKPFLGEQKIVQMLTAYTYFELKGVDVEKSGYTKYLLGNSAMERLMMETESDELFGNCVVLNLLHVDGKLKTAGKVVQGVEAHDYTEVSRVMNIQAPMCYEICDKTDGWIGEFERDFTYENGPERNDSLDFVTFTTTNGYEPTTFTLHYKNMSNGFDIGTLIIEAYNCTREKIDSLYQAEEVLRAIYECAENSARPALDAFVEKHKDVSGNNLYDKTHATSCVAGALIKSTVNGPDGLNPLNIAVACSDNKKNNPFVLGVPFTVSSSNDDGDLIMSTFLPSGGYSALERTLRYVLGTLWGHELEDISGAPDIYYDPFGQRTILDDITSNFSNFLGYEGTRLSEIPVEERIYHMSHLLDIYNTAELNWDLGVIENGCYYSCYQQYGDNFTRVPNEEYEEV